MHAPRYVIKHFSLYSVYIQSEVFATLTLYYYSRVPRQVIATTLLPGFHVDGVAELDQEVRDDVGRRLLSLTLRELFEFNVMQSDPNWGNYLYDVDTNKIGLIDFGASRECVAMGRRVDAWMGGWDRDGWIGGWVDGWMGGWVDGLVEVRCIG